MLKTKQCSKCKEVKSVSEFYPRNKGKYLTSACKLCIKVRNKNNKEKAGYYKEYQDQYDKLPKRRLQWFKADVKKKYGITYEQYLNILQNQRGLCKICKNPSSEKGKKLHLDHCHTTGKIRGFLCRACNHGLGNFKDNVELLELAIKYLKESKK